LISSLSACAQKTTHATIRYSNSRDIDTEGMEKDILYYINQYRSSIGLPALQMISAATEQATQHSIDMANRAIPFGHDGFDERMDALMKDLGGANAAAENVAFGPETGSDLRH